MRKKVTKKKSYNFHPYLFAFFMVLSLYGYNKDLINPSHAFWPTIIVLFFAIFTNLFFILTVKKRDKAAVLSSIFIFTFLSFGHYVKLPFLLFQELPIENLSYYISFILWLVVVFFCFFQIKKSTRDFSKISFYLNIFSIILVFISFTSIFFYELKSKDASELINSVNTQNKDNNTDKPDIYYIVLDGFARQDILKEIYNADNSNFVSSLENLGFFVASQSTSNYPQTYLSISSTLNMQYLDDVVLNMGKNSTDRGPLRKIIKDNQVYKTLKEKGYTFVSFPYTWTGTANNQHADIFMQNQIGLGEFGDLLVDLTPLSIFARKNLQFQQHRSVILHTFDTMPKVAAIQEPTFTYTHILAPHPPFVFEENGEPTDIGGRMYGNDGSHYFEFHPDKEEYRTRYAKQTAFVAKKTLQMVREILANSEKKPVIILQSDHGPGLNLEWEDEERTNMQERFGILNAYLLPTNENTKLYEDITPVNSFRVIFNNIFNTDYKLLPDKNYFARWNSPYNHIDVTSEVK